MLRLPHYNHPWVYIGAIASAILWALLLVCLPLVINDLPEDFFSNPAYLDPPAGNAPGLAPILARICRNALGWFLILVVGPVGLSAIAILFGFILIDLKGKMKAVLWIAKRNCVWSFLGFVRRKAGRPPLLRPCASKQAR